MRDTDIEVDIDWDAAVIKGVLTGRIEKVREPIEGLLLAVLLLVGVVCGMLLERRWTAIEARQDSIDRRQTFIERQQAKTNEIMFGHI